MSQEDFVEWREGFEERLLSGHRWGDPDGSILTWVQRHVITIWLSARQVATLLNAMAIQTRGERERIEIFVACWSRIVDEEHIFEVVDSLSIEGVDKRPTPRCVCRVLRLFQGSSFPGGLHPRLIASPPVSDPRR